MEPKGAQDDHEAMIGRMRSGGAQDRVSINPNDGRRASGYASGGGASGSSASRSNTAA
jgi:hypothetical protein